MHHAQLRRSNSPRIAPALVGRSRLLLNACRDRTGTSLGVIFISHSSRNNDKAVVVRDWLFENGWGPAQIFLDLDAVGGGERWRARLDEVGNNCEAVIVCLSDEWIRSPECAREFTHAESRGKPIFPIVVAPLSEQIPRFVSDLQYVDISDPAVAEKAYETLKLGLKRAQIGPDHFAWPPTSDPARAPYRGLKALEEDDAAIFFGRDAQITAGLDTLRQMRSGGAQRVLTIAAASGAGKSSFLKAGLLARLRRDEENFLVLPTWRPARDALGGEAGLLKSLGITAPGNAQVRLAALQAAVIARLENFGVADAGKRPPPTLILPLDQAEELFSADNANAKAALDLLVQTLAEKPDLLVIATIRSDSLGALQADARIAGQLRLFNLPALPPSAFKEVIEGPAALARPPIQIEPALTDRLIADLDRADALPLLAFTLERLVAGYGRDNLLQLQEYETGLGGVSGAVNAAVEAAMHRAEADPSLPDMRHELDTLARAAFIPWLVQLDEADASPKRRVARLADLPEGSKPLIAHFVEERLLVASGAGGEAVIEVSHEAVLRHWRGLASWVSEERLTLEGLQRILRSAREWARPEKTRFPRSADLLVHRGDRLRAAEAYLQRQDMAQALRGLPSEYLLACRAAEDESTNREIRQRRRTGRWQAAAALILVFGFFGLATGGWLLISEQRAFNLSKSLMLARTAEQLLSKGDPRRALMVSILASRESFLGPVAPEARAAFASAAQSIDERMALKHEASVRGAAFSQDATRILTWSDDGTARLWDAATGAQIGPALKHEGIVWGAAFSRGETRILSWSEDGTARLWDAATGAQIGPALEHEGPVSGAAFSQDETRILTWSGDNSVRLWDAATGTHIGPALEHEGSVSGAAFSKDETRILSWSDDNTARLWDAATGAQIGPTLKHAGSVDGAAFSKDETRILSWSADGTVRLWDATWARRTKASREDVAEICQQRLQGSLAPTNAGAKAPFTRLVDARAVAAGPILRGREGEDVCIPFDPPWYDKALSILLGWTFR